MVDAPVWDVIANIICAVTVVASAVALWACVALFQSARAERKLRK